MQPFVIWLATQCSGIEESVTVMSQILTAASGRKALCDMTNSCVGDYRPDPHIKFAEIY